MRIQKIEKMGYSRREAEFLCLVALHSGLFVRRQFRRFSGIESGKSEQLLATKLLRKRHGRERRIGSRTKVVHLNSRSFYTQIDLSEYRPGWPRFGKTLQGKLMGLDFVLSHPDAPYLISQREKIDYFHHRLGIDLGHLPHKTYSRGKDREPIFRYLVEPLLILYLDGKLHFVYVDAEIGLSEHIESFLERHLDFLLALPRPVRLIFLSRDSYTTQLAEGIFDREMRCSELSPSALFRYLELERRLREKEWDRLPQPALTELEQT